MSTRSESLWRATHHHRRFAPLPRDLETDVAIVGAGLTGLTAAVLLSAAGRRVAVIERDVIGSGETGNTTSHLTEVVDTRYQTLISDFGEDGARRVAQSSREAIDRIEQLARVSGVPCGFERVPAYLYTERPEDLDWLARELDAARRAGCDVQWVDVVPLPFATGGGILWPSQAQVHATAYLEALLTQALAGGVRLFEQTRVLAVHDGEPCEVETDRGRVRAAHVVVAANVPVNNRVLLHTKMAAYRSYAIAAEVREFPEGLFWDTADPYHYTRRHTVNGRTYVIVGGEDHRTGLERDTEGCFEQLARYTRDRLPVGDVRYRWSGQIIEPVDGLPFIGLNAAEAHVYVSTGYSGNGWTFGTLGATIVSDLILGRHNDYAELYAATRIKPIAAAVDYVKENVVFPMRLATDRLTSLDVEEKAIQALRPGEGGIFNADEGKIAVCRDRHGAIHACSAVCTHLGCDVAWNQAEQTWDCPCHGSRFSPEGQVINGPAVRDLRQVPTRDSHVPTAR